MTVLPRITPTVLAMPPYLAPAADKAFQSQITRIAGDQGVPVKDGVWGTETRHHYSKDQPWSDDGGMLWLENSGEPGKLILSGTDYRVLLTSAGNTAPAVLLRQAYETRWRPGHPRQMVSWVQSTQRLVIWDVLDGAIEWAVKIASPCVGFGFNSEGTLSDDGRWLALGTLWPRPRQSGEVDYFQVIDLEQRRVGPRVLVPMPYDTQDAGDIDWTSISPLGNFVVIKYSSNHTPEYQRVFAVNKHTLQCQPQPMSPIAPRMVDTRHDTSGWIACMSHADMNVEAGREVIVGGVRFEDQGDNINDLNIRSQGKIISVDLATGIYRSVSAGEHFLAQGEHEASDHHTSCRAYRDRGWATHHYRLGAGVGADEIMQWKLDGSRICRRFGVTRSDETTYRAEAHPCPSPDGTKILYASDWMGTGAIKAYVAELP